MDLRKLEIFTTVARLSSFSAAAQELHMAQPAVSIAVRKLEESLATPLFDRSGRRVTLTVEGRALLDQALGILEQVEALKRSSSAMKSLLQGELSVACPSMLATYFLPGLLSGYLTEHPGLTASITQAGTARIEEMLLDDAIEIGVTTADTSSASPELELLPLVSEQMVVCVRQGHPWAKRKKISIEQLHQVPMVVYESGYFIRAQLDRLCAAKGVEPDFRMQSNFLPLLVRMVQQGLGITVGLKIMAQQEAGIVGIPLAPNCPVHMALARRRGRTISQANQGFLDWAASKL